MPQTQHYIGHKEGYASPSKAKAKTGYSRSDITSYFTHLITNLCFSCDTLHLIGLLFVIKSFGNAAMNI